MLVLAQDNLQLFFEVCVENLSLPLFPFGPPLLLELALKRVVPFLSLTVLD